MTQFDPLTQLPTGPTDSVGLADTAVESSVVVPAERVKKRHNAYTRKDASQQVNPETGKRLTYTRRKPDEPLAVKKRNFVARVLDGPDEKPLDVLLDNMRWLMQKARSVEKSAPEGELPRELLEVVSDFRANATDAATRAAPYIHARLAPIVPKGETGLTVNLVIEEA